MNVQVHKLTKRFGETTVLKNLSFTVSHGEFISVLGPSGVGKTTLLRILASLESPDSGTVQCGSQNAVLVFQDYVLFPFLTVHQNVAFGLEARRLPQREVGARVGRLLSHFGLSDKAAEYPARLSAGQKQRVALARALAVEPQLLLLDEPLANLDKNLKRDTALYLRGVQREFGITTICVTHDQEEAMVISDRIALLLDGEIKQLGTPAAVYYQPNSVAVARFMGPVSVLPNALLVCCEAPAGERSGTCMLRPEQVALRPSASGALTVREVRLLGLYRFCILQAEGTDYEVFTSHPVELHRGQRVDIDRVRVSIDKEAVRETV
ncbi:MAG: ABC transporter ATP-binding protein [Spirochaetaceae bacterium]|nr:MAG: ABC transporter ATP-binding protein [Spirochaetaceae bacterium]